MSQHTFYEFFAGGGMARAGLGILQSKEVTPLTEASFEHAVKFSPAHGANQHLQ